MSVLMQPEVPSRNRRFVNYLVYVLLGFAALGILLFGIWATADGDVLEIKNVPTPVRTIRQHPTADGVIIVDVDYCKKVKATGRVRVSFVSASREILLPVAEDKQDPICRHTEVPVLIPKDLPPDKYRINFRAIYDVNPLKRGIVEEFSTQEFEVFDGSSR